jgi:hypothetical protein
MGTEYLFRIYAAMPAIVRDIPVSSTQFDKSGEIFSLSRLISY